MSEHETCYDSDCKLCCGHDDHDHGICIDCGTDINDQLQGHADWLYDQMKDGE